MASPLRTLADQAFSRAAGAPLVEGNAVQLLCDAEENYPAWLDAIGTARALDPLRELHHSRRPTGREFAEALMAAAKRGVRVRVIYDWVGALSATTVDVLGAAPPSRRRSARRSISRVSIRRSDGWRATTARCSASMARVGFVTGLCVGDIWWGGERNKGADPWRDTGVAVRVPRWPTSSRPSPTSGRQRVQRCPRTRFRDDGSIAPAATVALRVIATKPSTGGMFRLDQLVAAVARERLWITDAYFVGASPYVQALIAAAADEVDVRLLMPGSGTDLPVVQKLDARRISPAARGRRPHLRMERHDGPRQDGGRRRALGASRIEQSEHSELARQLGARRRRRGRGLRPADGGRLSRRSRKRDGDRLSESRVTSTKSDAAVTRPRSRPGEWRQRRGTGRTRRAAAAGALRLGRTFGAALTARRALGAAEASC